MNATDRAKLWDQTYRVLIGEELKVKFPDGEIVPVWQLWAAIVRTPGEPGVEAQKSVVRIMDIFAEHLPEVPIDCHLMRAACIFLKSVDFEVSGHDADTHDLRALALFQGLSPDKFEVVTLDGEPMLRMTAETIRKIGSQPDANLSLH